jgi:orotidine-5'-phosphate decarboxylase
MKPQLIVALDVPTAEAVDAVVHRLPNVGWFKVGLELFTAVGPSILTTLARQQRRIFLDLKLHDIPRTVERAVQAAAAHGVDLLTLHAASGRTALRAAAEAAAGCARRPRLVAVTTLTSLGPEDLHDLGIQRSLPEQALELARLALESGVDGLVTSVHEAPELRRAFGAEPILVTPGIRPADTAVGDQKRVATPAAAVAAGATFLVVGRPILEAKDPSAAAAAILAEMNGTHPPRA